MLYDQQMKKIYGKDNVDFKEIISFQMLENGLYFVQILSVNGEIVGMGKMLNVDWTKCLICNFLGVFCEEIKNRLIFWSF